MAASIPQMNIKSERKKDKEREKRERKKEPRF
jgi:hypothetical protein